jgi:hemerythrin-like domain-containing protein
MTQTVTNRDSLRALLARDHDRLDRLFEELSNALRGDAREDAVRLWSQFEDGLIRHMELEEKSILPALAKAEPKEAQDLLREHGEMRAKLAELGVGVDLHQVPPELVGDFIEQLRHHARREDELCYRWAEGHLPESDRDRLAQALEAAHAVRQRFSALLRKAKTSGNARA